MSKRLWYPTWEFLHNTEICWIAIQTAPFYVRTNGSSSSRCISHIISSHGSSILIHSYIAENAYMSVLTVGWGIMVTIIVSIFTSPTIVVIGRGSAASVTALGVSVPVVTLVSWLLCTSPLIIMAPILCMLPLVIWLSLVFAICWMVRQAFTLTSIVSEFGSSRRCFCFKDPIYGGLALSRDIEGGKMGVPVTESHHICHVIDVHVRHFICSCWFYEIPNVQSMQWSTDWTSSCFNSEWTCCRSHNRFFISTLAGSFS